jgi:hypothetical protein
MMARRALAPLLWIGLVGMGAAAHAASLQATDTGLQVDAGSLGQFTLS